MSTYKVLVVDDIIINQKVAVKMLQHFGITSDVACNGLEAVALVRQQRYDLILMDIQMPEMDGLEATKVIRNLEGTDFHTPIVAVTANAMQGDREKCLQAGMDDYLPKPILQKNIDSIVEKWLLSKKETNNIVPEPDTSVHSEMIDHKRIQQINDINSDGLLVQLLTLYLDDLKQYSSEITAAMLNNNFQQIYESSHKLKGTSANLGISSIQHACIAMEEFAQAKDSIKISEQFVTQQRLMEEVRLHIQTTYI